jgi:hypothetical protein
MINYKKQPTLSTFLSENPNSTKADYTTLFIGDKKDSHRKMKSNFHNNVSKPYQLQVDKGLAGRILNPVKS